MWLIIAITRLSFPWLPDGWQVCFHLSPGVELLESSNCVFVAPAPSRVWGAASPQGNECTNKGRKEEGTQGECGVLGQSGAQGAEEARVGQPLPDQRQESGPRGVFVPW